jgi:hypothetical protein
MKNRIVSAGRLSGFSPVLLLGLPLLFAGQVLAQQPTDSPETGIRHVTVYYEKGKFGGWPANWGMWNWGNEILVGYTRSNHKDTTGHNYDQKVAVAQFSRSLDGGKTWKAEDAFAHGITEKTFENHVKKGARQPVALKDAIDFRHADFALTFRMRNAIDGGTSFYYTYDRGRHWRGPYDLRVEFPGRQPAGIVSRTDYIIEGKSELTAFLTVGFRDGEKNWRQVACVRTFDGGKTWKFLSWIGPEGVNSIMPASVRLGPSKILTLIRRTKPPEMVSFLSEDNGHTWTQLVNPVKVDANGNPPALVKLKDGRLCLVYGIRRESTMPDGIGMYFTFSSDEGRSWTAPRLLQGKDGSNWDMGYPRVVLLPDGNVLATYYYNHTGQGDKYRRIAASIFDPNQFK